MQRMEKNSRYYMGFTAKNENGNKLPPVSIFNPKQYNR